MSEKLGKEREDLTRLAAQEARRTLGTRGVMLFVDWGDGELSIWTDGAEDSSLFDLADEAETKAKALGKLVR